ncbi:MAG: glycosyltransferase family 4 protein [Fibrobacteria bacterium]|nr:glycosyltransferase family 4 protein [Fibrobacteria bacterium]
MLCIALAEEGVDVHVLTSRNAGPVPGCTIHAVVEDWSHRSPVRRQIEDVLKSVRPDVVQIQYPASYGTANRSIVGNLLPYWVKGEGRLVCTTLHEWGERALKWKIRAAFMGMNSDAVVSVTSIDASLLTRMRWIGGRKVHHIPIGANLEFDRISGSQTDLPVLSYFGFLHPLKGVGELLEAARLLHGKGIRFRLDLHGHFHPESDAHHASILEKVESAGLNAVVRFPGPVPSDPEGASEAFHDSWLGVLPFREGLSERRGSFLALGRAGLPILTSPGPWCPSWVVDGRHAFLEPLVPQAWAQRLEALLSLGLDRLDGVGTELRREILDRHAWRQIAKQHVALWESRC